MSAPVKKRELGSFGAASPIELPTPRELEISAEGCALGLVFLYTPHMHAVYICLTPAFKHLPNLDAAFDCWACPGCITTSCLDLPRLGQQYVVSRFPTSP